MAESTGFYPSGKPAEDPLEITRDRQGRPLVSSEERRRVQALELAVSTFRSPQGLDAAHTTSIITRAQAFERFIEGD